MKRVCTVCARGGSKGVPRKNLRPLAGRPLIVHTLEKAIRSELFEVVAVSSDDPEILEVARANGAHPCVRRPDDLATDEAGKLPVIRHCVEAAEELLETRFDVIADLDVTAPLRDIADISGAIALLESTDAESVITGSEARRSPYFNLAEIGTDGYARLSKTADPPILRRQASPACYDMNGSIYAWRREPFMTTPALFYEHTRLYEMPVERAIDIDSELDLQFVEWLLEQAAVRGDR